jgi:hypothetical protein
MKKEKEIKYLEELISPFNIERELSKIKIPIPFLELSVLDIARTYHDLYSFDARKVKCYRLIKDMVVTLAQLPFKIIMMDVVVGDVPSNYGMLLSRTWEQKLGGSM